MTRDYGLGKPPRYWLQAWPAILAGVAVMGLVGGGILVASMRMADRAKSNDAIYWNPQGPACRTLDPAAFMALHLPLQEPFAVGKASFVYATGRVDCIEIPAGHMGFDSYSVCQFTGPGEVKVSTPHGDFYFAPTFGFPATLSTKGERPTCVQASNYK